MTWQDDLNAKRRKTKGWYGCIAPDGWQKIIEEADAMLLHIDPDYEIHQIKEKFGTLRYYFGSNKKFGKIESDIMYAIVGYAEAKSSRTCEKCGKYGGLRHSSYVRTLCDECATEAGYTIEGEQK